MMVMVICVIFITTAAAAAPADEFGMYVATVTIT